MCKRCTGIKTGRVENVSRFKQFDYLSGARPFDNTNKITTKCFPPRKNKQVNRLVQTQGASRHPGLPVLITSFVYVGRRSKYKYLCSANGPIGGINSIRNVTTGGEIQRYMNVCINRAGSLLTGWDGVGPDARAYFETAMWGDRATVGRARSANSRIGSERCKAHVSRRPRV